MAAVETVKIISEEHPESYIVINKSDMKEGDKIYQEVSSNKHELTHDDIVIAIEQIDRDDATLWTGDNKPQIAAITAQIDGDITISAAQRDAAWKEILERTE